ncbi:MAG TPA: double zinc ribbon domain-containing protein [Gemmatimonadales bacterium]
MPSFAESAPRRIFRALGEVDRWLLPSACLLCEGPVPAREHDALVCGVCRARWRPVPHPLCARCGQPSFGDLECRICADWPPGLARVRSAVWLAGGAQRVVHLLKYDGWWRLVDAMAEPMVALEPLTGGVCLIPVPLAPGRLRARGYNQSERLASALAARLGLVARPELLVRARETPTQTALTPEARRANVSGAFAAPIGVSGRVVLVDDVFTTGATLLAAAAALIAAGAEQVDAVTFGRAVEPVG